MERTRETLPSTAGWQGIAWSERAVKPGLAAVLDPADAGGRKNAFIDAVHAAAFDRAVGRRRFERALDFGCGIGRFLGRLNERAAAVYGVDATPAMIELARARNIVPPERLSLAREGVLPFAAHSFDLLLSVYVLSCMYADDRRLALAELARVAAPGALFVAIEKLDAADGLDEVRFRAQLAALGFTLVRAEPVRAGPTTLCTRLALRYGERWLRVFARLESALMRLLRPRGTSTSYVDYLFVARRERGP